MPRAAQRYPVSQCRQPRGHPRSPAPRSTAPGRSHRVEHKMAMRADPVTTGTRGPSGRAATAPGWPQRGHQPRTGRALRPALYAPTEPAPASWQAAPGPPPRSPAPLAVAQISHQHWPARPEQTKQQPRRRRGSDAPLIRAPWRTGPCLPAQSSRPALSWRRCSGWRSARRSWATGRGWSPDPCPRSGSWFRSCCRAGGRAGCWCPGPPRPRSRGPASSRASASWPA